MADVHNGPTILHVGERKHGDKNFETSEVVLAAPGTVVAPIPKGMKVTQDNAILLLLKQLLQAAGSEPAQQGGPGVQAAPTGAAGGEVTSPNDPYQTTSLADTIAKTMADYNIGNRQQNLAESQAGINNIYASDANARAQNDQYLKQQAANRPQPLTQPSESGGGGSMSGITSQLLSAATASKDNAASLALQKLLGMRGLDIQSATQEEAARQDAAANALRQQEISNQFTLGKGQLTLQDAQNAFSRIMAGVSEASLPGSARYSVPQTGVYS